MKLLLHALALLPFALPLLMAGPFIVMSQAHAQAPTEIGGQKVVTLTRKAASTTKPEFTSVTLAPGRGMELLQVTANFPGKGNINVLASPDMDGIKKMLDVDDTSYLAVTLEDDPAADLQAQHGRFLYFSPDEVEPCP